MKTKTFISIFILFLLLNIIGGYLSARWLENFTKPFLMITLISWFLTQTNAYRPALKKWIVAALCFSWLGDVLLMFQGSNAVFFLLGLSAFLIAHIFFILFFYNVKVKEVIKTRLYFLSIVVCYYTILTALLYRYLGEMKIPVLVYGLVISIMLLLVFHMLFLQKRYAGVKMTIGAILFVISDSVLAINKFYQPFEAAGIIIMLTYGFAQLLIVKGAIEYIFSKSASPAVTS